MQKIKSFGKIDMMRDDTIAVTYLFKHKYRDYSINRKELETLMTYKNISTTEYKNIIATFNIIVEIAITNSKDIISIDTRANSIKITTLNNKTTIIYLEELQIITDDERVIKKIDEYLKD